MMIYPTLGECLEMCKDSGILRVEGVDEIDYVYMKVGFKPRLVWK